MRILCSEFALPAKNEQCCRCPSFGLNHASKVACKDDRTGAADCLSLSFILHCRTGPVIRAAALRQVLPIRSSIIENGHPMHGSAVRRVIVQCVVHRAAIVPDRYDILVPAKPHLEFRLCRVAEKI